MKYEDFLVQQYREAIRIRNFEITLFWKRGLFFAAFVSAVFVAMMSKRIDLPYLKLALAFAGLFLSYCWLMAQKGSKYWYESWESKVIALEQRIAESLPLELRDDLAVKLYHYWLEKPQNGLFSGSMQSVSKVTIAICLFSMLFWIFPLSYYALPLTGKLASHIFDPYGGLPPACMRWSILFAGYILIFLIFYKLWYSVKTSRRSIYKHKFFIPKNVINYDSQTRTAANGAMDVT